MATSTQDSYKLESSKQYRRSKSRQHNAYRRPRNSSPWSLHSQRFSTSRQVNHWSAPVSLSSGLATPSRSMMSLPLPYEQSQGITMERTRSGNSIVSDTPYEQIPYDSTSIDTDDAAAKRVEDHFRRVPKELKQKREEHERRLRKLIKLHDPKDPGEIDDKSLLGILTACDTIFFAGDLAGRVEWEWSSLERYQEELIGTTAFRRRADGNGFETLIILSEPILLNPRYDRRLRLSAFLHELIHCYLFIRCGFDARVEGGHTKGWHRIAKIINDWVHSWVGVDYLSLCNKEANLEHFHKHQPSHPSNVDEMYNSYHLDIRHETYGQDFRPPERPSVDMTRRSGATFEVWPSYPSPPVRGVFYDPPHYFHS